jgi:hypothetical protein
LTIFLRVPRALGFVCEFGGEGRALEGGKYREN